MLPIQASRQCELQTRVQEDEKSRLKRYRSLTPVYDLRINIWRLFEFSALQQNRNLRGKKLLPALMSETVPKGVENTTTHVWMRCYPGTEKSVYDFIDTQAKDLKGSSSVFCRVFTYPNQEGYLYNLVAPSFRGKTTVKLVQNFMALLDIRAVLFSDVTTMIGCCKEAALHSLHLHQVVTTGKSWYGGQGATKRIDRYSFPYLHDVEYVSPGYEEELQRSKMSYDSYRTLVMKRRFGTFASDDAYIEACQFLHGIEVDTLKAGFVKAQFNNHAACLISAQGRWNSLKGCTLGSMLLEATSKGSHLPNHAFPHVMMHELRDLFISNKDSDYSERLCSFFKKSKGEPTLHGLTLAFFVLASYTKVAEEHEIPQDKVGEAIVNLMLPGEKKDCIEQLTNNFKKSFLEMIERERGTPISTKLCAHSTPASRRKWVEYLEPIDHDNNTVLQEALIYLLNFDIETLRVYHPVWVANIERLFEISFAKGATFASALAFQVQDERLLALCFDLIESAMKNFSQCSVQLFRHNKAGEMSDPVVDLFMIAKFLVKRSELFQFELNPAPQT